MSLESVVLKERPSGMWTAHINGWLSWMPIVLAITSSVAGALPSAIDICTQQEAVRVGEPLLVKMTYAWPEPVRAAAANECQKEIFHSARFRVRRREGHDEAISYPILAPLTLKAQGGNCLAYAGDFVIFYDHGGNRLTFGVPGRYELSAEGYTKTSNVLQIEVLPPSPLEKEALSLLSDASDYHFLAHGGNEYAEEYPQRMEHLRSVADRCQGTVLASWCAARVGLKYYEEFRKKHPRFKEIKALYQDGAPRDLGFELACKYLALGANVPDEIAIREELLFRLFLTEDIKGANRRALVVLNKLIAKYPEGKYSKAATKTKEYLEALIASEEEQEAQRYKAPIPRRTRGRGVLGVVGGIGVAIAAGVVLVVLLRKKPRAK